MTYLPGVAGTTPPSAGFAPLSQRAKQELLIMSFKVTLLAGVASLALATGGAQAQQFNATDYFVLLKICGPGPAPTGYPCVYDSKNQIVGLTTTDGPLLRRMGGSWYKLPYENTGFFNGYSFYYTSSDCSGTPYLITGGGSVNGS